MEQVDSQLRARVRSLELTLARTRRMAVGLVLALLVVLTAGMSSGEEVVTSRLILMGNAYEPGVVLRAGPEASLVIETSDGKEIARIGGPAARPIGDSD